jgi:hypothetical protein
MNNISKGRYFIVLLLGSYDYETKQVLFDLKNHVIQQLMYYDDTVLIFLLDKLEIYSITLKDQNQTERDLIIICENYGSKITFLTLESNAILDADDMVMPDNITEEQATINFIRSKYPGSTFSKLPIIEKLSQLADASTLTLLIRHKELTRGGEYIELAFLLGSKSQPPKTVFLSKTNVEISEMVWELLDYHGVNFRQYKNEHNLATESIRLIRHFIRIND